MCCLLHWDTLISDKRTKSALTFDGAYTAGTNYTYKVNTLLNTLKKTKNQNYSTLGSFYAVCIEALTAKLCPFLEIYCVHSYSQWICRSTKCSNKKSLFMTILVCSRKQFDVIVLNKSYFIGISLNSPEETPWSGFGLDVSYVQMANNKWHMWARDKKKQLWTKTFWP